MLIADHCTLCGYDNCNLSVDGSKATDSTGTVFVLAHAHNRSEPRQARWRQEQDGKVSASHEDTSILKEHTRKVRQEANFKTQALKQVCHAEHITASPHAGPAQTLQPCACFLLILINIKHYIYFYLFI